MHNPTRRSKRIGLTQGGRVKDGKARERWSRFSTRSTWQTLSDESTGRLRIIRENPSRDFFHPCTRSEVFAVLDRLPKSLTSTIRTIVLRRSSQDHEMRGIEAFKGFQCIVLNAFPKDLTMNWNGRPTKASIQHYKPWCNRWEEHTGQSILRWQRDEIKRYYLYHLLLHEIGHFNDAHHRPTSRREAFAEGFALHWAKKLGELS